MHRQRMTVSSLVRMQAQPSILLRHTTPLLGLKRDGMLRLQLLTTIISWAIGPVSITRVHSTTSLVFKLVTPIRVHSTTFLVMLLATTTPAHTTTYLVASLVTSILAHTTTSLVMKLATSIPAHTTISLAPLLVILTPAHTTTSLVMLLATKTLAHTTKCSAMLLATTFKLPLPSLSVAKLLMVRGYSKPSTMSRLGTVLAMPHRLALRTTSFLVTKRPIISLLATTTSSLGMTSIMSLLLQITVSTSVISSSVPDLMELVRHLRVVILESAPLLHTRNFPWWGMWWQVVLMQLRPLQQVHLQIMSVSQVKKLIASVVPPFSL